MFRIDTRFRQMNPMGRADSSAKRRAATWNGGQTISEGVSDYLDANLFT